MSGFVLGWVLIGSAFMLLYMFLFLDIDSYAAGKIWADPLVDFFIIFLWPIAIPVFLWRWYANGQRRSR